MKRCDNRSSGRCLQGDSSTPSVIQFQNLSKPTLKTTKFYKNLSNIFKILSVKFQLKIKSGSKALTEALTVIALGVSCSIFVLPAPKVVQTISKYLQLWTKYISFHL